LFQKWALVASGLVYLHLLALEHGAVHLPQACGSQGGLLERIKQLIDGLAELLLDDLDRLFGFRV